MSAGQGFEVRVPMLGEPRKRASGIGVEDSGAPRRAVRAMLQRVAESAQDSRELAAVVVLKMPPAMRAVHVREFLSWIRGSNDRLVAKYMRAATISSEPSLGDLTGFQRAALIGVLRLRRI
jgi:hypothetical protein